jgi:2-polyprenyl-3-methyl-5-hydroxy-6-metoxy-1,4-benzoquinol methylase
LLNEDRTLSGIGRPTAPQQVAMTADPQVNRFALVADAAEGEFGAMTSRPFCHLCDRLVPEGQVYARKNEWSYLRCPSCGLILLHPVPNEPTLRSFYNDNYQVDFKDYIKNVRRSSRSALDDLRKQFPGRGKLLEIGCSYGGFLSEARRDGWQVTGVELSENAAGYAREQQGLRVFSGSFHNKLGLVGERYEAVVLFHVIEHMSDPIQFLKDCRRAMKPGGLLVLKTPNAASLVARLAGSFWQWVSPPAHLYLYSPKTLQSLLKKTGYQPVAFRSAQGDANNNLFAVLSSVAKRAFFPQSAQSLYRLRRSLPVRVVEAASEFAYSPFRILIDPWLDAMLRQPELYALALNGT